MAQKAITIYTKPADPAHITCGDDAAISGLYSGQRVRDHRLDDQLACARVNDTSVSIAKGVFFQSRASCSVWTRLLRWRLMSGRLDLIRNDLIVAEYVVGGGDTSDVHVLKVIKGTQTAGAAADPTLGTGRFDRSDGGREAGAAIPAETERHV